MPSPQLEHGHTRIANELLEQIARELTGSGTQLAICLLIMRYSYGFNRKHADLTVSETSRMLGCNRKNVSVAIDILVKKNIIDVQDIDGNYRRRFQIQKDYSLWGVVKSPMRQKAPCGKKPPKVGQNTTEGVAKSRTSKKVTKKVTKKVVAEPGNEVLKMDWPHWIRSDVAAEFEQHRREIRKKLTPTAFGRLIKKLDDWRDRTDPNDVIINSIANGWQGIFPEKSTRGAGRQTPLEKAWRKIEDTVRQ